MISLFKKLFRKKVDDEAHEMWAKLQKQPNDNPLDNPRCKIDCELAINMTHEERQAYLQGVWEARRNARVKYYTEENKNGTPDV